MAWIQVVSPSDPGSSYWRLDIAQVQVVLLLSQSYFTLMLFETCIRIHTFLKRTTNALTSLLFEKHLSPHLALRDGGNH